MVNKHAIEIYWRDYKNGHEDIMMKKSHDGGKTFKIPVKLNADPLDLWKDDRNHFNAQ